MHPAIRSVPWFVTLFLVCFLAQAPYRFVQIEVDLAHPGAAISPQMFGIFFEDINFAADGGLYPELIKNRSFEFNQPLAGWRAILRLDLDSVNFPKGEMGVRTRAPLNAWNEHYLHAVAYEPGYGMLNLGYRGMGVRRGAQYIFSAYARSEGPKALRATITDPSGAVLGSGKLEGFGKDTWKQYQTIIQVNTTSAHAMLNLYIDEKGALDLDQVSLFPVDTWKRRPNGLRKDLVQFLYDMHPGFLRFPGGCIVEGRQLGSRYRWKTTVGDIAQRKTLMNRWNDEFDHRPTPDYFQSFGLGFYEYFQLAEDIGARPLPVLNCGMACQFDSEETAKTEDLHEYVQDALDLIEFANGPSTSAWGALRAKMGHPAPFHMQLLGIGNEQFGPRYIDRYKLFAAAIKSKYPEIQLVVSTGYGIGGESFNTMWQSWHQLKPDIVDEHYYKPPVWFLANSRRYDNYNRSDPKVYVGEFSALTDRVASNNNRNNWWAAISEAAFMTGLERNGDVVQFESYAPLFANVDAWQWTPDAIWFDSLRSYATPNYYVQRVFANNAGTRIIPATPRAENGLYTSATLDERTHQLILKAVNASRSPITAQIMLGDKTISGKVDITEMGSVDTEAENSFSKPDNIAPVSSTGTVHLGSMSVRLKPYSLNVYRIPVR